MYREHRGSVLESERFDLTKILQFAETWCVKKIFLLLELDHGERLAVSSARSALDLPRPRLLRAHVLWRLSPPSFPLTPAA